MTPPVEQLSKAIDGDPVAREALGAWCLDRAFDVAFILLCRIPNRDLIAEEVASEASLRAISSLHRFTHGTNFTAWLNAIVQNCVRDYLREEEKSLPRSTYRRWVHDFFVSYRSELEMALEAVPNTEAGERTAILQRVASDLNESTYYEFMQLSYSGPAALVLRRVKEWLRTFVEMDVISIYALARTSDDAEGKVAGTNLTEVEFMQQELVDQVNRHLGRLHPICQRVLRWYYMEDLRAPEIACLERVSERTAYRRIERCTEFMRGLLASDEFFSDLAVGASDPPVVRVSGGARTAAPPARKRRPHRHPAEEAGRSTK